MTQKCDKNTARGCHYQGEKKGGAYQSPVISRSFSRFQRPENVQEQHE